MALYPFERTPLKGNLGFPISPLKEPFKGEPMLSQPTPGEAFARSAWRSREAAATAGDLRSDPQKALPGKPVLG